MSKKVVVKKKSSHPSTGASSAHQRQVPEDDLDLELDDLLAGRTPRNSSSTSSTSHKSKREREIEEQESRLDKLESIQQKQENFIDIILNFIMNYGTGIVTIGIISAICIVMLRWFPKILADNPSYKQASVLVITVIIVFWAGMIALEFLRLHQRHKKAKK